MDRNTSEGKALDSDQIAVLHFATELSYRVDPERLEQLIFDQKLTYEQVAGRLFPEEEYINTARTAVCMAAQRLLSGDPRWRKFRKDQAREVARKSGEKNMQFYRDRDELEASELRVHWSQVEIERLFELIENGEHNHPDDQIHKGKPDYYQIAQQLNLEFHEGQTVRDGDKCATFYCNENRRAPNRLKRKLWWTNEESDYLSELAETILYIDGIHRGQPDYSRIMEMFNARFPERQRTRKTIIDYLHRSIRKK